MTATTRPGMAILRDGTAVPQTRLALPDGPIRVDGQLLPRVGLPPQLQAYADAHLSHRAWRNHKTGLVITAGLEAYHGPEYGPLLHVAVSWPNRLPSWKLLGQVKDLLYGDAVEAAIVLPRKREYVNVHPYCHHLWQVPDAWADAAGGRHQAGPVGYAPGWTP